MKNNNEPYWRQINIHWKIRTCKQVLTYVGERLIT